MDLIEIRESVNDSDRHPWELSRSFNIKNKLVQLLNKKECGVVIDIGCGDVFAVNYFSSFFPKIKFYAIDTAFDQLAMDAYSKNITTSNVKLFNNYADLELEINNQNVLAVLLLDVLEHIEKDKEFLFDLSSRKWFTKETKLVVTVPAFQFLFSNHDVFLKHFRRYSNTSLKNVIESCNFKTVELHYFYFSLLIPRIILKFFNFENGSNINSGRFNKSGFLKRLVIYILNLDFILLDSLSKIKLNLPGLSNICICEKVR